MYVRGQLHKFPEFFAKAYQFANFKNSQMLLVTVSPEAVARVCSVKKVFLEISQNSRENTCARVFFNKVAGLSPASLSKKKL